MSDVVLYLHTGTRALVAIAPPGATLPDDSLTDDTIQMQVTLEAWQALDAVRQTLPAGRDLVVNADGSTTVIAHVLTAAEQSETTLLAPVHAFARHPAPSDAMKEAALRAIIRHLGLDS